MNALRTLAIELGGLFVEDRWFAAAIAMWLALNAGASFFEFMNAHVRGYVLFLGLALVLIAGVVRGARRI